MLAAQQTLDNANWYQGTADAVRQNLRYVEQPGIEYVLILSGDQLYRMNFQDMMSRTFRRRRRDDRRRAGAQRDAARLGIMRLDDAGRVMGFLEKPKTEQELERMRTDRPGSTPAASPATAATAWPTWASTCSTATR